MKKILTAYLVLNLSLLVSITASGQSQADVLNIQKKSKSVELELDRIKSIEYREVFVYDGKVQELTDSTLKFHTSYELNRGALIIDTTLNFRLTEITGIRYCVKKDPEKCRLKHKGSAILPIVFILGLTTGILSLIYFLPILGFSSLAALGLNELVWRKIKGVKNYNFKHWKII